MENEQVENEYENRPVPEELRYTALDLPGMFRRDKDGKVISTFFIPGVDDAGNRDE